MLVINKLTKAGDIKKVALYPTEVVVTTQDKQVIVYRRMDGNAESNKA